jgi:nuclear receptor subfamily 1 group D protein 3
MFEFAERLNSLALNDSELGLFCAVVVIAAGKFLSTKMLI